MRNEKFSYSKNPSATKIKALTKLCKYVTLPYSI